MDTHSFLPLSFFEGGHKIFKKLVRRGGGGGFIKKLWGNQKGAEKNTKVVGRMGFYHFGFSLLAIMVTDNAFKKFRLGNILSEKCSLVIVSTGHIIQTY